MGNVAAFKTRITLESDQYIAGWKKVETATTNKVSGIEAAISKGMKSWSNSMGKAISGFLGIQLADTLLKSIDAGLGGTGLRGGLSSSMRMRVPFAMRSSTRSASPEVKLVSHSQHMKAQSSGRSWSLD